MKNHSRSRRSGEMPLARRALMLFTAASVLLAVTGEPARFSPGSLNWNNAVRANSTYTSLSAGSLAFNLTAASTNLISSNDNWSGVPSVEGYFGENLTATHGVDPQTVLNTEFASDTLPNSPTNVSANKGNPSAFNAGGIAEFDSGTYISIGLQGNVQANPYLVFYANSLGRTGLAISYELTDIDGGSNNSVSPVALQYRVGSTGPFTNLPAGYVADATEGPNISGLVTTRNVSLPPDSFNQPVVQLRLITTNAASTTGSSTPDEWIGVNNVVVTSSGTTAAETEVGGRVTTSTGAGVSRAFVEMIDASGHRKSALTNPFGYYRISGLLAGQTYLVVISSKSKRFRFESHVITVYDADEAFDFVASDP